MLIIPEIETIVILPPRTGSGSLYRSVLTAYPKTMMLYRHMEADGVPFGYDRWRRIGVLRHPVARLWSLYNYLGDMGIKHATQNKDTHADYHALMRQTVAGVPFEDWLLGEREIFTCHQDRFGKGRFYPQYAVKHAYPETKKSQFTYLRPDLGVEIVPYHPAAKHVADILGIDVPPIANVTNAPPPPRFEPDSPVAMHFQAFHGWDLETCVERCIPRA